MLHEVRALILGRVAYGEADFILTFFSDSLGRFSALARGARRSQKRFAGTLEPMHTLRIHVEEPRESDLMKLRESLIVTPRLQLTSHLGALEAAGRALSWLRKSAPLRTPEPQAWLGVNAFLDELDADPSRSTPRLVELGVQLLAAFGWGLELTRCVRCGRACPEALSAFINPERGGLVCRSCGGGPLRLKPAVRLALLRAAWGESDVIPEEDLSVALEVVERALTSHVGVPTP